MPGDLHTHSTFSDSSCPPERLPELAARQGLSYLAVSDHDSLRAVQWAQTAPVRAGVQLLAATELTAYDEVRGRRVHLLCYCPRVTPELREHCRFMARERNAAAALSMADLEKLYPQFRRQDALALAGRSGVVFKTHSMRVLFECGYTDGIYKDLYKTLFGRDGLARHDPAYRSVEQVLAVIHSTGGVAVLAHPSVYHSMELAAQLAAAGAIDGVEIDHPRNTPEDRAALEQLAQQYNLIVTGGSDFHGMYASHPVAVGDGQTADGQIARILSLAASRDGNVPDTAHSCAPAGPVL